MSPSRWICMDVTDIALPENCPQNESCTCKNTRDRITLFIFIPRQAHRAFNASDVRLTQRNLSLISLRNHTVGLHSFFLLRLVSPSGSHQCHRVTVTCTSRVTTSSCCERHGVTFSGSLIISETLEPPGSGVAKRKVSRSGNVT